MSLINRLYMWRLRKRQEKARDWATTLMQLRVLKDQTDFEKKFNMTHGLTLLDRFIAWMEVIRLSAIADNELCRARSNALLNYESDDRGCRDAVYEQELGMCAWLLQQHLEQIKDVKHFPLAGLKTPITTDRRRPKVDVRASSEPQAVTG